MNAYSLRFWNQEHATYYARILMNKMMVFKHQYLDMPSLYTTTCFRNIAETIDGLHAHRMFALGTGYNLELIKNSTPCCMSLEITLDRVLGNLIQGQDFHLID